MLQELSIPPTAKSVAEHYQDFLDGFIMDSIDEALTPGIQSIGIATTVTDIVMHTLEDRVRLAQTCLEFIESLSESGGAKSVSGV